MSLLLISSCTYAGEVAWLDEKQNLHTHSFDKTALHSDFKDGKIPLGSLWKLFTYLYLVDTEAREEPYVCSGDLHVQKEEQYCCTEGSSIDRDRALSRSCGLYFDPKRLNIDPKMWESYWENKKQLTSIRDLESLKPETKIDLKELLSVLQSASHQGRLQARKAMLETSLSGYGRYATDDLGSGVRYKTYSWHKEDNSAFGGAAGWSAGGNPFWFGGAGNSQLALKTDAKELGKVLTAIDKTHSPLLEEECVDVDFFAQYPLKSIRTKEGTSVDSGMLVGGFSLEFFNGNRIAINTKEPLGIDKTDEGLRLKGRFGLNHYVARVIDREADTTYPSAAYALGVAARTYLFQNGHFEKGCWHITDSTRTQRVSPNSPSAEALQASRFTDELVLKGPPIYYHADDAGLNRLSWEEAQEQAQRGWSYQQILSHAYPESEIQTIDQRSACTRLFESEKWLKNSIVKWNRTLSREDGYEPLEVLPNICFLPNGHPYSDQKSLRIYTRGGNTLNDKMTLAHEYIHLAFRFHPNGSDEAYVEHLAQTLIGENQ
ncbi:DUF2300 domain-containing protein [Sulfuricurvum sp.]|uniref:DUF2300 domain-containing protein n=1 Tax=Sulfuricurvum sp. TaxID=2025608 RepID=UPI002E35067C|nr:DUF2300 domain-containing protein [Sulfuricurvum sp.]HEX5330122.1 DUF2300 domain-containing protein [Sulfuricurvum sp.]